jgi:Type IIA topoisomerase (DNA gyrase/topo II, topoisomerase IV), A subunit
MERHRILFKYSGDNDDAHIRMAFSKKLVDERKTWLTTWMEECRRRKEMGIGEDYLYTKTTKAITYTEFVNKELILFSNMDNERSIPSLCDGLKPGSRKVSTYGRLRREVYFPRYFITEVVRRRKKSILRPAKF